MEYITKIGDRTFETTHYEDSGVLPSVQVINGENTPLYFSKSTQGLFRPNS